MMDMLNAGLLQFIVADDWKARMWAQVLPKVKPRNDLVLREGAKTGWAIRKDSPKLKAEIADFFQNWALKNGVADYRMNSYMKRVKELKDPTGTAEWKRFEETLALFEKYGKRYGFDPLMLAAQGYQESQLNQSARSHVGAIGVMQIMPATGAELGVGDIRVAEPNIHGGAKYMDKLMTRYFRTPGSARATGRCSRSRATTRVRATSRRHARKPRSAARPGQVVQQRRDRRRREDRHGDDDVRAQHLQVLRRVPAHRWRRTSRRRRRARQWCRRRAEGPGTRGLASGVAGNSRGEVVARSGGRKDRWRRTESPSFRSAGPSRSAGRVVTNASAACSAAGAAARLPRPGAGACPLRSRGSCPGRRPTSSRPRRRGCGWRCGRGTAVVRDHEHGSRELEQRILQRAQRLDVEVVRRFVEQEHVAALEQRGREVQPAALASGQRPTSFCWSCPLKLKRPR